MYYPVVYIFGVTASGKTRLSIDIWEELNKKNIKSEIVNCDSMQLYKGFDIGTGKVSKDIKDRVPHHLLDILEDTDECTVSRYISIATKTIDEIHARNSIPIVVGGSHMYIKGLIWKSLMDPTGQSPKIITNLEHLSNDELFTRLQILDPNRAKQLHCNDRRRVLRSLEIFYETGQTFNENISQYEFKLRYYPSILICIENLQIEHCINLRVHNMVQDGIFNEVILLKERLIENESSGILQSIAYKEFKPAIDILETLEDTHEVVKQCIKKLQLKTLQYSRKQRKYIKKHLMNTSTPVHKLVYKGTIIDNSSNMDANYLNDDLMWYNDIVMPAIKLIIDII
ncbi:tRNA delta -isopentenylpyrophosphate transferase [Cryptosporidium andersoni]|uniref:tRNA dimethylallyltransferase n=1 Tax=Cryptosporidium andersoni TaxID=117008 RepID=A0A1J4MPI9_9CRYT|nr:tRNA delta -isopentenylpyrophosphate transferase [Cryptosporidium andersoni]